MQVTFAHGIGDKVKVKTRGDALGRVVGAFVGKDRQKQISVAYVDADGLPAEPAWFSEADLEAVAD